MSDDPRAAAAAAGAFASDERHRELLQSVVDVARAIFGAKAASVFLLDRDGHFQGTIAYREDMATALGKLRNLLARS